MAMRTSPTLPCAKFSPLRAHRFRWSRQSRAVVLALVIAVVASSQATAGMCEEPPYGANPKRYKLFVDIFTEGTTLDFFPNICRAKYKSDDKIRKALVD